MFLSFFIQICMLCFQAFQSIFLWRCEPTPQVELLEKQAEQQKALDEAKDRDGFSASMVQAGVILGLSENHWACFWWGRWPFCDNKLMINHHIDTQNGSCMGKMMTNYQMALKIFREPTQFFWFILIFPIKNCYLGYILYHFQTKLFEPLKILLSIWEGTIPLEEYHGMRIDIFF